MKIALNMGQDVDGTGRAAQDKALERDIMAAKGGDWTAKQSLARTFQPLIASLAQKRTRDQQRLADFSEAGRDGLVKAARKYRPSDGPHKFRIQASEAIQEAMDRAAKPSLFARLLGRG
jgi:DNA-directed RNA polymerase specialized sigma subunit